MSDTSPKAVLGSNPTMEATFLDHISDYFLAHLTHFQLNGINASVNKSWIIAFSIKFFIFTFLSHFCTILRWKTIFCSSYITIKGFRRKSEFLPTLPIDYDHCALPFNKPKVWVIGDNLFVDRDLFFSIEIAIADQHVVKRSTDDRDREIQCDKNVLKRIFLLTVSKKIA